MLDLSTEFKNKKTILLTHLESNSVKRAYIMPSPYIGACRLSLESFIMLKFISVKDNDLSSFSVKIVSGKFDGVAVDIYDLFVVKKL